MFKWTLIKRKFKINLFYINLLLMYNKLFVINISNTKFVIKLTENMRSISVWEIIISFIDWMLNVYKKIFKNLFKSNK